MGLVHMGWFKRMRSYWQACPPILGLSALSSGVLLILTGAIDFLAKAALASQGRVAVTTGDYLFVFTTWQGWAMGLLGLLAVYLSFGLSICASILMSDRLVKGERAELRKCIDEGLRSITKFANLAGVLVVAYVAFVLPVLGVGLSISLTENLRIPTFITDVINKTPLFKVAYSVVSVAMLLMAFFGAFTVHGVLLDGLEVRESISQSLRLVKKNWKNFLWEIVSFTLATIGLFLFFSLVVTVLAIVASVLVTNVLGVDSELVAQLSSTFTSLMATAASVVLVAPLALIKITQLYRTYTSGEEVVLTYRNRHALLVATVLVLAAASVSLVAATVIGSAADELFPPEITTRIVAHRAGGNEAPENSVAGINKAAELGAWASEIDIQRTTDGAYVVNHDDNFSRVAGDARKPYEMSLAEVRELRIGANAATGYEGEPVPTYEEILEAARDKVVVLVELKGATADRQMADDAVRIAREMGMLDQCVFISLKYDVVSYIETTYPEAETGYLAFGSYGDIAKLDCDNLLLEELAVTTGIVNAVHEQGKGVYVWTLNDEEQQRSFLPSGVDAIITDNVVQALRIKDELEQADDYERIMSRLMPTV